jgi:hypothetical protein
MKLKAVLLLFLKLLRFYSPVVRAGENRYKIALIKIKNPKFPRCDTELKQRQSKSLGM